MFFEIFITRIRFLNFKFPSNVSQRILMMLSLSMYLLLNFRTKGMGSDLLSLRKKGVFCFIVLNDN